MAFSGQIWPIKGLFRPFIVHFGPFRPILAILGLDLGRFWPALEIPAWILRGQGPALGRFRGLQAWIWISLGSPWLLDLGI